MFISMELDFIQTCDYFFYYLSNQGQQAAGFDVVSHGFL